MDSVWDLLQNNMGGENRWYTYETKFAINSRYMKVSLLYFYSLRLAVLEIP